MSQADLAVLGLEVRSDGVATASSRLDDLDKAAGKAERATSDFTDEVEKSDKAMSATAQTAGQLSKALATIGVSITAAFSFTLIKDFEQSMSSVRAITRATGAEFDSLRTRAKELGATTRYTASQAAEAMRMLGQAGFNTNEILVASGDVLALAQSGAIDLADAAEISAKALRGFRLEVDEMTNVADLMAKAANASNTNIRELGEAFTYAGPVATSLGVSIKDTTAAIAALSDAGISSSMAGTTLRGMLSRLANPTRQATKLLNDAGLSVEKLDVRSRGLIPVLEDLANSSLGVEEAMVIFGQRAGPGFEVLQSAIPKLQRFSKEWENIGGYAKETADIMDDNLNGSILRLVSAVEDMILSTAEATGLTEGLTSVINTLAGAITTLTSSFLVPWLDNVIVAFGAYIAAQKLVALYTSATTGAIGLQISLLRLQVTATGTATAANNIFIASIASLRAGLLALATSPIAWITVMGAGLYMLWESVKEGEEEMQRLRGIFKQAVEDGDDALRSQQAAQEFAAQSRIEEAERNLAQTRETLSKLLDSLDESVTTDSYGVEIAVRNLDTAYGSIMERIFGVTDGTKEMVNELRTVRDALKNVEDAGERLKIVNTAISNVGRAFERFPHLKDLAKQVVDELQALGGAVVDVADKSAALDKANGNLTKVKTTTLQVRAEIKELENLLDIINKKPVVPQTAAEALTWLKNFTKETDLAKKEQHNAELAVAQLSLALLGQAHILAILEGRFEDATAILKAFGDMQAAVANVKPPKASGGGADKAAKAQQAALDKIQELQLKILETQAEINGAGAAELQVYKLKIEQAKELREINRQAAEAGTLGSKELQEAKRLTEELYKLKIAVAEYAASWEPVLRKMQDAVDLSTSLGYGADQARLKLLEMQKAMIEQDPNVTNEDDRIRRLRLLSAEMANVAYQSRFTIKSTEELYDQYGGNVEELMQKIEIYSAAESYLNDLYSERQGAMNELIGQQLGLDQAWQDGMISLEEYNIRLTDLAFQMLEIRQQAGDTSFIEDITLGLSTLVEGYEGVAAGLTETFGNFFQDFTTGFANSIGQAIVYSEDLNTALNKIAKQAIASLISSLIQLGIQWAVNAVIAQTIGTASATAAAATAAVTGSAIAAAYAPAAAMASLASFGANAAPAMAGMMATSTMASVLASLKGFKDGGFTGMMGSNEVAGVVHGGEYVFDKKATDFYGVSQLESMSNMAGTSMGRNAGASGVAFSDERFTLNITAVSMAPGVGMSVERVSRDEVRIIAREEAEDVVSDRVPELIETQQADPSSRISRSQAQNWNSQRKY